MTQNHLRTYYALAATQAFSALGSRISGLAIGIWIFQQSGHATPLTTVAFFAVLPTILGGGLAGALADRFDRRLVMVCADAGQAVGTVLLLISFLSGAFALWHLYVVALLQAAFAALQTPAFQASIATLATDAHRDRANAIVQISGPAAGVLAPAVAGLLFATIGVTGAIAIDLATFVVAVLVVLNLHIPRPVRTAEGTGLDASIWRQAFDGFRYLKARPVLLGFTIYGTVFNCLIGGAMVLLTPYVLARTGNEAALGLVFSALNGGAIAGGVLAGIVPLKGRRIHGMMIGVMAASLFLLLSGAAREAWGLGTCLFLFMASLPFMNVPYVSIMQAKIAPDVQGRVFAAMAQLSSLTTPVAFLVAGPLADRVFEPAVALPWWHWIAPIVGADAGSGMGLIFVLSGGLSLLLSLVVYVASPIRRIESALPDHTLPSESSNAPAPTSALKNG